MTRSKCSRLPTSKLSFDNNRKQNDVDNLDQDICLDVTVCWNGKTFHLPTNNITIQNHEMFFQKDEQRKM